MWNNSVLKDPVTYDKITEMIALGLPQREIAKAYGLSESTVSKWVHHNRKFKRRLAEKQLEILQPTLEQVKEKQPLAFIERHPVTKEDWAPPAQRVAATVDLFASLDIRHLIAIAEKGLSQAKLDQSDHKMLGQDDDVIDAEVAQIPETKRITRG